jgi:hypothetical protein
MSNSSVDLQTEATSNGPETANGKKSLATNGRNNGLETETETDLGSAASSANSSGDDGEASEDEDDEDPEVSFTKKKPSNSRRTTRQATRSSTRKNDQSTSSSKNRKEKLKKSTSRCKNNSSPAPVIEKHSSNRAGKNNSSLAPVEKNSSNRRIRRGSPLASLKTSEAVTKPKRTRKSSMIESCQLCSDMVEDLSRHLSLNHFKSKLVKLLPSQSPFKCPKCASVESSHENLIRYHSYIT